MLFKTNLQIFATQVTTQESLSAEMKTYYDMELIEEAQANLVHDQFGQKRPIPANGGKTIEFRKFAPLNKALVPLTEGVTPSGNSLAVTTITATPLQYGDFIVQSDVLELTAIDNTILEATKLLGAQAGKTLDTVTRNVLNSGLNVTFASKWSGSTETEVVKRADLDATSVLKVDTVKQVATKLRACNAPTINGDYVAIVHPYVAYELKRDPDWIDAYKYANPENLYNGEIGKVDGVRFVESSEAKIFAGADIVLGTDASGNNLNYLTLNGAITAGAKTTFDFDGITVEADALIGKWLNVGGVAVCVTDNDSTSVTFASTTLPAVADNTKIYAMECEAGAVFSTLFLAEGAYGVTEITGGGLQTIIKQKGSSGVSDALDQRSSVGWKALKTAEILIGDYLVRVESCSPRYSKTTAAN